MTDLSAQLTFAYITLNEESNLGRSLASLPRGTEVVVLDSGSTDRTQEIARQFGAKVATQSFTDYASQKNAAITMATKPWVFVIDADEELTPALRAELEALFAASPAPAMYEVPRQLFFMGRLLRFGKSADSPLRLFPRGQAQFVGGIHEQLKSTQPLTILKLKSTLIHYSYRNLEDYFRRFNHYTTLMAGQRHGASGTSFLRHLIRPWFEFLNRYVLRGGFLDGYPGYTYALISSLYAFVKYAKVFENHYDKTKGPRS